MLSKKNLVTSRMFDPSSLMFLNPQLLTSWFFIYTQRSTRKDSSSLWKQPAVCSHSTDKTFYIDICLLYVTFVLPLCCRRNKGSCHEVADVEVITKRGRGRFQLQYVETDKGRNLWNQTVWSVLISSTVGRCNDRHHHPTDSCISGEDLSRFCFNSLD